MSHRELPSPPGARATTTSSSRPLPPPSAPQAFSRPPPPNVRASMSPVATSPVTPPATAPAPPRPAPPIATARPTPPPAVISARVNPTTRPPPPAKQPSDPAIGSSSVRGNAAFLQQIEAHQQKQLSEPPSAGSGSSGSLDGKPPSGLDNRPGIRKGKKFGISPKLTSLRGKKKLDDESSEDDADDAPLPTSAPSLSNHLVVSPSYSTPPPLSPLAPPAVSAAPAQERRAESREERRAKIAREILETEQSYVAALQTLLREYRAPMVAWATGDQARLGDVNKIFGALPTLVPLNEELLRQLETRLETWCDWSNLGDIFTKLGPFLKIYHEYSNAYDAALDVYTHRMERDPTFRAIVEAADARVTLKVESCLIMPVQRVPRYVLLLTDLLHHTDPKQEDYQQLEVALAKIEEVATYLDNSMRESQQRKKFVEISAVKGGKSLLAPHRRLVMEGQLAIEQTEKTSGLLASKSKSSRGLNRALSLLLFNDILVHTRHSKMGVGKSSATDVSQPENQWPLSLVWIIDVPLGSIAPSSTKAQHMFKIIGPSRWYIVAAKTSAEKDSWMREIRAAVATVLASLPPSPSYPSSALTHTPSGGAAATSAPSSDLPDRRYYPYTYPEGMTYDGEWLFGRMHGSGALTLFNSVYQGEWHDNLRHGHGRMTFPTGDSYTGPFERDVPHGHGEYKYMTGDTYAGSVREGRRCGRGVMTFVNGDVFEGEWVDNVPHGFGVLRGAGGVYYEGGWREGLFEGEGTLQMSAGKVYRGGWKEGRRNGKGQYSFFWGQDLVMQYDGDWVEDRREGVGQLVGPHGLYEGEFSLDLPNGMGKMRFCDGAEYNGAFRGGMMHGEGRYVAPESSGRVREYVGEFKNGCKDGKGVIVYHDGSRLEGTFRRDQPHGNCVLAMPNGAMRMEVKFQNGVRMGQCRIVFTGRSDLEGEIHGAMVEPSFDIGNFRYILPPPLPELSFNYVNF